MADKFSVQIPRDEFEAICTLMRHALNDIDAVATATAQAGVTNVLGSAATTLRDQLTNLRAYAK